MENQIIKCPHTVTSSSVCVDCFNKQQDLYLAQNNKSIKNYCYLCGSKLELVESGYFNEATGEKIKVLVCKKVGCKNNCAFCGCELTKSCWRRNRCIKCGEIPYSECY